jgi:hypothetical protein
MEAEGWYQDPYGIHEDRWYSDGHPTALVRDAGLEASDPPPPGKASDEPLVRSIPHEPDAGNADLRRAGDRTRDYAERAFDVIGEFIPPN